MRSTFVFATFLLTKLFWLLWATLAWLIDKGTFDLFGRKECVLDQLSVIGSPEVGYTWTWDFIETWTHQQMVQLLPYGRSRSTERSAQISCIQWRWSLVQMAWRWDSDWSLRLDVGIGGSAERVMHYGWVQPEGQVVWWWVDNNNLEHGEKCSNRLHSVTLVLLESIERWGSGEDRVAFIGHKNGMNWCGGLCFH